MCRRRSIVTRFGRGAGCGDEVLGKIAKRFVETRCASERDEFIFFHVLFLLARRSGQGRNPSKVAVKRPNGSWRMPG
jgi:hypothetical protein